MLAPDAWVPLAEVVRPHGVRGDVQLKVFNDDSDVLSSQEEVLVRLDERRGARGLASTARAAPDDAILMKLYSVDDRDRAGELRGALVCARRAAFPPLEEGEFYACDVIGARVRRAERERLEELGTVRAHAELSERRRPRRRTQPTAGRTGRSRSSTRSSRTSTSTSGVVTLTKLDGLERG